jgi:hypothetical protein
VPEPSFFEAEIVIVEFKSYNSRSNDQIPAEMSKAEGEILCSEIQRLTCSIWNKEELPEQWKESIIVSVHKKGDKTDCNNYGGISLLSTAYILSNILPARLTPYNNEVIGDHQCVFRPNRSATDQIFFIRKILGKMGVKWNGVSTISRLQERLRIT